MISKVEKRKTLGTEQLPIYRYRAASNLLFLSFFFFEIESINFILFLLFICDQELPKVVE